MTHVWSGASVVRLMPTSESVDLLAMVEEIATREIAPRAGDDEATATFPREVLRALGGLGILGLPFDETYGGGAQPYEVCLQVLEELARASMVVGVSVSVHWLACFPLANFGTSTQRDHWLPDMVGGDLLGGYCLAEARSGSAWRKRPRLARLLPSTCRALAAGQKTFPFDCSYISAASRKHGSASAASPRSRSRPPRFRRSVAVLVWPPG